MTSGWEATSGLISIGGLDRSVGGCGDQVSFFTVLTGEEDLGVVDMMVLLGDGTAINNDSMGT